MSDSRHWIMNPAGHRAFGQELQTAKTGDTIDTPYGEAVFIDTSEGISLDTWICDICNGTILSRWGDEPMPVPAEGSSAFCDDCRERIERGPAYSESTGEPIPHTQAGPWPPVGCHCPPCQNTTQRWGPQLVRAYDLKPPQTP